MSSRRCSPAPTAPGRVARRARTGQAARPARARRAGGATPARGRAVRAVRDRPRPRRAARPGRRAAGHRAARPLAAGHRRRLPQPERPGSAATPTCGSPRARSRPASSSCGSAWARGSAAWSPRPPAPMSPTTTSTDDRFQHTAHHRRGRAGRGAGRHPRRAADARAPRHRRAVRRRPPRPGLRAGADRPARLLRRPRRGRHRHRQPARRDPVGPRRTGAGQRDRSATAAPSSSAPPTSTTGSPNWSCAAEACTTWPPRSPKSSTAPSSSPRPTPHPPTPWRSPARDGHAVRHEDDWIAAVAAGGELLGALVLRGHPGLDPVDQRTLERAAMVTSLLLLARRSAAEAEQRVRGELLDDLLDARDRDPRLLRERAARLHADLDAPHVVLAARLEGTAADADQEADARRRLAAAASHLAATRHGLAAARDGGTVLLLPLGPGDTADRPGPARRPTSGHGGPRTGHRRRFRTRRGPRRPARTVAAAYAEARRCLDSPTRPRPCRGRGRRRGLRLPRAAPGRRPRHPGLRRPHHRPGRRLRPSGAARNCCAPSTRTSPAA